MQLKNNTTKIIGIGTTTILPGETVECPIGYENNPVVKQYIKNGTFERINKPEEGKQTVNQAPATVDVKSLEDMGEDELIQYAAEHAIDLGKATSKEGVLKKIQETQKA